MPDQGLVEGGVSGNLDTTDIATSMFGAGTPDGAVAAAGVEVDHVASCGWPYASACPRCFPPLMLGERRSA